MRGTADQADSSGRGAPATPPAGRWKTVAWGVATLGFIATLGAVFLPEPVFRPVYAHSSLLFPLFTVVAGIVAWRRRRAIDRPQAWSLIAVAIGAYYLYEVLWYGGWLAAGSIPAAVTDLVSLLGTPFLLVATLRSTPVPADGAGRRRYLDAAILSFGIASLAHAIIVLGAGGIRPMDGWDDLLLIGILTVDLGTIAAVSLLLVRSEAGQMPTWAGTIAVATLIGLVSDMWYATSASIGHLSPWFVQGSWYGHWAMLGLAAAQAIDPEPALTPRGRLTRLPHVLALACYGALAIAVALGDWPATVTLTASVGVITVLVLIREILASAEMARLEKERSRLESDTRLAALVHHGSDMLMIVDAQLRVRYASPSHQRVLGIAPAGLVGRSLITEVHRDDLAEVEATMERLVGGSPRESVVARVRDATGEWRWIECVGANLLTEPTIAGLVLTGRDISDRKRLEVQLLEQALRDPLTGLANRRLFGDRLAHALARRHLRPDSVAVLLLDLDHFKVVNDTLGHAKGDALLVAVAERLRGVLRSADTVARLGGDEFAILLEDLASPKEADQTAARIQQAFGRPFLLDDREVVVRASIGIAWATEGQEGDDLLTDADVAMYGAKSLGRGCTERFSPSMRASVAERHHLEADLRLALERDEFEVLYQPVVDLRSGQIAGAEALVRWRHPVKGLIGPARFIPIAEESDLILAIGGKVIRQATLDAARFQAVRPESARIRVAINLSARQLLAPNLVEDLIAATKAAGITGSALAIELTESVLASNEGVIAGRLHVLRDLGIRVALDDFGTGYSALSYLRMFPIDVLKVDKSFVSWVREDGASDGVTKAIIAMGQSLSLRTVAEGVETADQLTWLRSLGCSLGQGYLFSLPVDADQFARLLEQWNAATFAAPGQVRHRVSRPDMAAPIA